MKYTPLLILLPLSFAFPAQAQDAPLLTAQDPTAPAATTPAKPQGAAPAEPPASQIVAATNAYNAGLAALQANDLATAGARLEDAIRLYPGDASAQMLLGYVRLKQGRHEDAVTALRQADAVGQKLDARARAEIWNNLGIALGHQTKTDEAIAAYQHALTLDATYNEARYNLAFALLSADRPKDALPHLTQLAAANPKDASLQDGLGEAYESQGDYGHALGAYRRAMTLAPQNAAYPLRIALALISSSRRDAASAYLRQAIALDPRLAPAHLQLGTIFVENGRWKEARNSLERYVALQPDDFTGWYNLGVASDYDGDLMNALQAYARAESLNPNDAAVKNNIGRIYFKQGEHDKAIEKTRQALALDSKYFYARHNLALALTAKGQPDAANAEWRALIEGARRAISASEAGVDKLELAQKKDLLGLVAAARGGVAENLLNAEKYADAASEYASLLALTPTDTAAMSNRGLALYHTKDYEGAIALFRQVIKREPKNAIAFNNLGVALEAQSKKGEALNSYRQALKFKPDYAEARANIERLTTNTAVS